VRIRAAGGRDRRSRGIGELLIDPATESIDADNVVDWLRSRGFTEAKLSDAVQAGSVPAGATSIPGPAGRASQRDVPSDCNLRRVGDSGASALEPIARRERFNGVARDFKVCLVRLSAYFRTRRRRPTVVAAHIGATV